MRQAINALYSPQAVPHEPDLRAGMLYQPIKPGGDILPAIIDNLVRGTESFAALGHGCRADAVVPARVHSEDAAAQLQETFGEGVEERRAIEVATRTVDEAKRVDSNRGGHRGRAINAVEPKTVSGN